jgi:hypothetical protein
MPTKILTHRGLDPSRNPYFAESSREAFANQLARGFGLEFDLRRTKDDRLIVIHDSNLRRISNGKDDREIQDVALAEILAMDFEGCRLMDLPALLQLIKEKQSGGALSALHLKYGSQEPETLDLVLAALQKAEPVPCIIFDVTVETARYLKERDPSLELAPSVAHPYDIARYNAAVGGTLYAIDEILPHRDLFRWVWLDEWDLVDENNGTKHLYTKETFNTLRAAGFSIGLVSPELHASSPGLLGGEAHPDAKDRAMLTKAIKNIVALSPDLICTDYPDLVRGLIDQRN